MPTYVTLVKFTQKGIERIKEGPARLDDAKQTFESMGAEIKEFYLVMGRYDMVIVIEAPQSWRCASGREEPRARRRFGPLRKPSTAKSSPNCRNRMQKHRAERRKDVPGSL